MLTKLNSFIKNTTGVAGIEAAFIFPVMLIVYFGLLDLTSILSVNRRVTMTASTLADLVTQTTGTITKAELQGFYRAANSIMDPYPTSGMSLEIFGYRRSGNNVTLAWKNSNGTTCGGTPSANTSQNQQLTSEGNDVITARVCYYVTPLTGKVMGEGQIQLSDQLTLRPRQSATLTCTDC